MTSISPKPPKHQTSHVSYYEIERRKFTNQPFHSFSDRHDFEYPLEEWGNYCQENRELRRSHYITKQVQTLDEVKKSALFHKTVPNADKGTVDIYLWKGQIENLEIDAIVNAANETLLGGGGVDHAIHSAAGPLLVKECAHIIGGCDVGNAKKTKGYCLPANYVLHTVGPILINNLFPNEQALKSCYRACLKLCEEAKMSTVAFPCISCGFYGYPVELSAKHVLELLQEESGHLLYVKNVILCLFSEEQQKHYSKVFSSLKIENSIEKKENEYDESVKK